MTLVGPMNIPCGSQTTTQQSTASTQSSSTQLGNKNLIFRIDKLLSILRITIFTFNDQGFSIIFFIPIKSTQSTTTTERPAGNSYCASNPEASKSDICGALDWHCNVRPYLIKPQYSKKDIKIKFQQQTNYNHFYCQPYSFLS